jgi:polyisoprenoid-binding protein YceI
MKKSFLLLAILVMSAVSQNPWTPADYSIKFETKKAKGKIGGLQGLIDFNPENPENARFDVTVDLETLDMGIGLKTKHARQEDFFNAEKYPNIRFVSTKISRQEGTYLADGALTIKDTTLPVQIPFTFTGGDREGTFQGKFTVNRKDFKLEKKGVGEEVEVSIVLPVKK